MAGWHSIWRWDCQPAITSTVAAKTNADPRIYWVGCGGVPEQTLWRIYKYSTRLQRRMIKSFDGHSEIVSAATEKTCG